jgi:pyruvate kinase
MVCRASAETSIGRDPVAAVATMARIVLAAESAGRANPGDFVVVVSGPPATADGFTNMLRVHHLGAE